MRFSPDDFWESVLSVAILSDPVEKMHQPPLFACLLITPLYTENGMVSNPERSSGDIFRELQCRSPGRYQPLQIRTLQRGMRKIRASLLETVEEHWQEEVIRGPSASPDSARCSTRHILTAVN